MEEHYDSNEYVDDDQPVEYANFGLRLAAYLIDGLILTFVVYFLMFIMGSIGVVSMGGFEALAEMGEAAEPDPRTIASIMGFVFGFVGIAFVGSWLYFALMESSYRQATLGKMAVGIKVTDMYGDRISFGKATGRYFGKIISGMILNIGYLMAAWTERRQALHDIMANCLVLKK